MSAGEPRSFILGPVTIQPGETKVMAHLPDEDVQPLRLLLGDAMAAPVEVLSFKIGNVEQLSNVPTSGEFFAESRANPDITFAKAGPSSPMRLEVTNTRDVAIPFEALVRAETL